MLSNLTKKSVAKAMCNAVSFASGSASMSTECVPTFTLLKEDTDICHAKLNSQLENENGNRRETDDFLKIETINNENKGEFMNQSHVVKSTAVDNSTAVNVNRYPKLGEELLPKSTEQAEVEQIFETHRSTRSLQSGYSPLESFGLIGN
ncbi:hypothetical protein ENBRE01_3375 [Enteropsectra breve]|nr:hypothetical protein ENBRE01_3375 [Enteropsectra breve]